MTLQKMLPKILSKRLQESIFNSKNNNRLSLWNMPKRLNVWGRSSGEHRKRRLIWWDRLRTCRSLYRPNKFKKGHQQATCTNLKPFPRLTPKSLISPPLISKWAREWSSFPTNLVFTWLFVSSLTNSLLVQRIWARLNPAAHSTLFKQWQQTTRV